MGSDGRVAVRNGGGMKGSGAVVYWKFLRNGLWSTVKLSSFFNCDRESIQPIVEM